MAKQQNEIDKAPLAPSSYQNIQGYALGFENALNYLGIGVTAANPQDEVFAVLMDVTNVNSIINMRGCAYVAGIIGVYSEMGTKRLTISLLGAGGNKQILPAHIMGGVPGQEVWPDRVTLAGKSNFLP